MSALSEQVAELRDRAKELRRCGCWGNDGDAALMELAADTIESLRRQVAKCQIAELKADYDTSRYFELFGTPEKTAKTLAGKCCDCCECVLANACEQGSGEGCLLSDESNFDALLEWLRGDA